MIDVLSLRIDPDFPLELLNGAGMVVEFFFLSWMMRYLWRETRRRGLGVKEWLRWELPPSMNFAAPKGVKVIRVEPVSQ